MRQKLIHTLTVRFFENDCPEPVRRQFHQWFAAEEDREAKDAALCDVWNMLPETVDLSSLAELRMVKERIQARASRRRLRRIIAVAAILLPLFILATGRMYMHFQSGTDTTAWVEHFVPDGERRRLTLSDGSTVWLNAGSILLYPEAWGDGSRTLYLSGEAHFNVTRDTKRPFIVKTAQIEVEALGTVFSVQARPGAQRAITTLESGSVRVSDNAGQTSVILTADEQAVFSLADVVMTKHAVDAARVNSWTQGVLIFQAENLKNIFFALEHKYNVKIHYSDSLFSEMTFTVRFHADESLAESLEVLRQIGAGFRYKITGNNVYIK
jgi:ferric-dicitrate binding protein FerR (iron transport regulator)